MCSPFSLATELNHNLLKLLNSFWVGLSGTDIPVEARIVAIADVFDALCSTRPYKDAWPIDKAGAEILQCSGSHFDPDCVAAFRAKWPEICAIMQGDTGNRAIGF